MSNLSVKWIYVLEKDFSSDVQIPNMQPSPSGWAYEDDKHQRRLVIHPDGSFEVLAGYAWDGCTPKFALLDIVFGTPDGMPNSLTLRPKTYFASLAHDAFYQFLDVGSPCTRKDADVVFLKLMRRDGFALAGLYFAAVRLFGGMSRQFTHSLNGRTARRVVTSRGRAKAFDAVSSPSPKAAPRPEAPRRTPGVGAGASR